MEDLITRLKKRAEIRRQIATRKSVQEGKPDRIADLLEEAASELEKHQQALDLARAEVYHEVYRRIALCEDYAEMDEMQEEYKEKAAELRKERDELKQKLGDAHEAMGQAEHREVELLQKLEAKEKERKEWERLANEWMNDYQKLKDKYEPLILVTSEALSQGGG